MLETMNDNKSQTTTINVDGKEISVRTGRMAKQPPELAKSNVATPCFWLLVQQVKSQEKELIFSLY